MRALSLLALLWTASCATRAVSPALPTESEWLVARAWLEELRAGQPSRPFGAVVHVNLREPVSGRSFSARGAVAVDPHHALRMILLGPGGGTALDVWVSRERWRFEVPAIQLLRRGGMEDDPALPVGFFRWWFLAPVDGRLLTSVREGGGESSAAAERFILRDGPATVDLTDRRGAEGHSVTAVRRVRSAQTSVDRVDFHGASFAPFAPQPGDRATYDRDNGVHVDVTVEASSDTPDPVAFDDPDARPEPHTPVGASDR